MPQPDVPRGSDLLELLEPRQVTCDLSPTSYLLKSQLLTHPSDLLGGSSVRLNKEIEPVFKGGHDNVLTRTADQNGRAIGGARSGVE